MNFLDIIFIILNVIVIITGLIFIGIGIQGGYDFIEKLGNTIFVSLLVGLILIFTLLLPFLVIDKGSGVTIGTITSVDKNFFGTTSIYIKTSENIQERYCIENQKIADKAKELVGKKVKINYGERIGLYSTGKCDQAPIENIEVENE